MSVTKVGLSKWQKVAGIGVACGIALAGCDRSDKEDTAQIAEPVEQENVATENTSVPAVRCDDPIVQDRLKHTLSNTLSQQTQMQMSNYANESAITLNSGMVRDKASNIVIDVQNAALLQAANSNGMTTCQASVSMTLPSEDLYQASQVQAAANQPSLQSRLAKNNIRINNNMLVDDAFTYVVGTQGGQISTRIAGQPALITVVANVMADSAYQLAMNEQKAAEQKAQRRAEAVNNERQPAPTRQPREVAPVEPIRPVQPPTIQNSQSQSAVTENNTAAVTPNAESKTPATQAAPKSLPKNDNIDMVIIEDESATY